MSKLNLKPCQHEGVKCHYLIFAVSVEKWLVLKIGFFCYYRRMASVLRVISANVTSSLRGKNTFLRRNGAFSCYSAVRSTIMFLRDYHKAQTRLKINITCWDWSSVLYDITYLLNLITEVITLELSILTIKEINFFVAKILLPSFRNYISS